ncbi:MAG: glutamate 5-kinase [Candidatus Omnitrophota bacterium]
MKKSSKTSEKIVVKVGSSILTGGRMVIVPEHLSRIVSHVANFIRQGKSVILVTSGAVASGLCVLGFSRRPSALPELQAAAAVGQSLLMQAYACEFAKYELTCAQILITREDFHDRKRYLNARNTINKLLYHGVVPVINENDAISTEEIKFGDNDTLSASVAAAVEADGLLILTDIDGLYRHYDSRKGTRGEIIKEVEEIGPEIHSIACGTDKNSCVGGMSTKITAAVIATTAGVPTIIASGQKEVLNIDFKAKAYDHFDGTRFLAVKSDGSKKHWIEFEAQVKGRIMVDEGAKKALVQNCKSLLAPGITAVEGHFKAGDIVEIIDCQGAGFARGKVNYSSLEIERSKQKRFSREVVHRDHLVILG